MSTEPERGRTPEAAAAIAAIHDRYVREIVEALGLCPYARRCRESGRLQRPIFDLQAAPEPTPRACAEAIVQVSREHPDVEVLLLTFAIPRGHRWAEAYAFEDHARAVREAYAGEFEGKVGPRYYMVAFHPAPRRDPQRPVTQDSLVSLIRRTPDPVIQCIRADLLDGFRRQAQIAAEARFRAEIAKLGPELQSILAHAVQPDPELSSEIARVNFKSVGQGEGRRTLDALVDELIAARRAVDGDVDDDVDDAIDDARREDRGPV
ncbi:MAG: hypothetical protein R3B09_16710 [Nannocystaceae bacterium]